MAFCLLNTGYLLLAQEKESQITIDITREVDGKTEKFSKTYSSKEEMEADEELQSFSEDLDQISHVKVSPGGTQTIKIQKSDSTRSYSFDFDTDVKKSVRKKMSYEDMDDDSLAIKLQKKIYKLEEALANMGMDIKEEVEILQDMDWDEIRERHKIVIIDEDEETEEFVIEDDEKKLITISTTDGNEFGKRGKISNNELLEPEIIDYYPNPSPGKFRLKFRVEDEAPLYIRVYNSDDQEVFLRYFPRHSGTFSEQIDLRGQEPGTYMLEISHDKKRLVRKMVIQ